MQWLTVALATCTYAVCLIRWPFPIEKAITLALFGMLMDYGNMQLGVLSFEQSFFPIWLLALWFSFTWYAYILKTLLSRYPLTFVSVLGGVAGALSYVAGHKFGAVSFDYSLPITLSVLFVEWSLIMALIAKVYGYGKGNSKNVLS